MNREYAFPPEIFAVIIRELDTKSILTCKRACKAFNSIIHNDPQIQYKIELTLAGMVDGPRAGTVGFSKRQELLRQHEEAWRTLSHLQAKGDGIAKTFHVDVCSRGYLIQGTGPAHSPTDVEGFHVRQLPSRLRGIEASEWTHAYPEPRERMSFFHYDPNQDLVVVRESFDRGYGVNDGLEGVKFHFLSASTEGPHQDVSGSHVLLPAPTKIGRKYSMKEAEIWNDHIVVRFSDESGKTEVVVRSWKAGDSAKSVFSVYSLSRSWKITTTRPISTSQLILGVLCPNGPEIRVIDLAKLAGTRVSLKSLEFTLCLQFPATINKDKSYNLTVLSEPDVGFEAHVNLKVPFSVAQSHRIMVFIYASSNIHNYPDKSVILFYPLEKLLMHLEALQPAQTGCTLKWEEWGPDHSLMRRWPERYWNAHSIKCHGMRVVIGRFDDPQNTTFVDVLDFNPRAYRKHNPDLDPKGQSITIPKTFGIFEVDVTTRLPYTISTVRSDSTGNAMWNSYDVTEDHFIVSLLNPASMMTWHRIFTVGDAAEPFQTIPSTD